MVFLETFGRLNRLSFHTNAVVLSKLSERRMGSASTARVQTPMTKG